MSQDTDDPLTDAELVEQARRGDQQAFGQLYDRYAPLVRARCYDRSRNLHDAQELCQEVFLRVFSKLHTLRDAQKFPAWLLSIQVRVCQEKRRSLVRGRDAGRSGDGDSLIEPDQLPAPDDARSDATLEHALAQLSERRRTALHAYYLLGQDVDQARSLLELSQSGFYKLLKQAREELQRIINKGE